MISTYTIYKEERKITEAHGTPTLLFQDENKLTRLNSSLGSLSQLYKRGNSTLLLQLSSALEK